MGRDGLVGGATFVVYEVRANSHRAVASGKGRKDTQVTKVTETTVNWQTNRFCVA